MATINTQENPDTGYEPDLSAWVSRQHYHRRNLIPILIRSGLEPNPEPSNALDFYDGQYQIDETLRALIELHPVSVTGLDTSFNTLEPTSPKRVEYTYYEKYGRPIDNFFMWWHMRYRAARESSVAVGDEGTIDVMFIEPDPTHTKVVAAFFMWQMRPVVYSGIESKRDISRPFPESTRDDEPPVKVQKKKGWFARLKDRFFKSDKHPLLGRSLADYATLMHRGVAHNPSVMLKVTFGGQVTSGPAVVMMGQRLLTHLNVVGANPYGGEHFLAKVSDKSASAEPGQYPEFDKEMFAQLRVPSVDVYKL